MIQQIIIISLQILGIYCAWQAGNILSPIRVAAANLLDKSCGKLWSRMIQKPLWDCLPCMASIWSIILTWIHVPQIISIILCVAGINFLLSKIIDLDNE